MSTSLLEPPAKPAAPKTDAPSEAKRSPRSLDIPETPVRIEPTNSSNPQPARRPGWRRRRYIVDWRFQLKMSLMTGVFVLVPLIAFNLFGLIHGRATVAAVARAAPQLAEGMARQNRFWVMSVLIISALFLVGVIYVKILETHRTAGPAYRLARGLEALRDGKFGGTFRLRDGDNLGELCTLVNAVAGSLREREQDEIEELERLATSLERDDPADAVATLRELAQKKRALLS